jgi:glycerophosphoryl diester phosphodiesterase
MVNTRRRTLIATTTDDKDTTATATTTTTEVDTDLSKAGAHGDVATLLKALFAAGVDGLFSDFPDLAVAARGI